MALRGPRPENKIYELAGEHSFSISELAEEVSRQSSRPVVHKDLPAADIEAALLGFGLPPMIVDVVVDASVKKG